MKAAIIGPKITDSWQDIHNLIKEILNANGVKVDFNYFSTDTDQDAANLEATYKKNLSLIRNNDFIIAETTDYSGGIGYLIASALASKTPVLALYNKKRGDKPSNIIKSSSLSRRLEYYEYEIDELAAAIEKYIIKVRAIIDTKFILNLPSQLDRFLEYCSYKRGVPKAHIVRESIENLMNEYEGWEFE